MAKILANMKAYGAEIDVLIQQESEKLRGLEVAIRAKIKKREEEEELEF